MAYQKQKTPLPRILQIVRRFYALEQVSSKELAKEYEVNPRTIYRDMLKISEHIPLLNISGVWELNTKALSSHLDLLPHSLLSSFAHNIDIDVACLEITDRTQQSVSFATEYKDFPKQLGEKIVQCIADNNRCQFIYVKDNKSTQRVVDPIKFYTENGRWYLVLRDYKDDKIKTFLLNQIKEFQQLTEENRTLTSAMIEEANAFKSVWSSGDKEPILVRLYLKPEMAHYNDIKLHKSEVIHDKHHDGGREAHYTITHKLEILPAIKSWLPYVHILEPKWLWEELNNDLDFYSNADKEITNFDT